MATCGKSIPTGTSTSFPASFTATSTDPRGRVSWEVGNRVARKSQLKVSFDFTIPRGECFFFPIHSGGFLVSPSLDFTSQDTVFLYPDCRTALIGTFVMEELVVAFPAEVMGIHSHCGTGCPMIWPVIANIDKVRSDCSQGPK